MKGRLLGGICSCSGGSGVADQTDFRKMPKWKNRPPASEGMYLLVSEVERFVKKVESDFKLCFRFSTMTGSQLTRFNHTICDETLQSKN